MSNDKQHFGDCDGANVYTDHNMYGLHWTCACGAATMNSIVGANYKHRDAKSETEGKKKP